MILCWQKNGGLREIFAPVHTPKKKVRGGGRGRGQSGNWELRTAFSQLRIQNCLMSIMALEFPTMQMNFALGEFEFKVSNLNILLLMATLGHRKRLGGWVLSKRLVNKSAWSSSSEVLLHVFSDIINFRVFWVNIHFGIRRSRRHCY